MRRASAYLEACGEARALVLAFRVVAAISAWAVVVVVVLIGG